MQTFLPLPSFSESARILDNKRLGKQRVECLQILNVLSGKSKKNKHGNIAWSNHPAVLMWKGYESCLAHYGMTICDEWKKRGFKDTCYDKIKMFLIGPIFYPTWIGNDSFHASHRSNLLRKNKSFYGVYGWTEPPTLPYIWPK